MTPIYWNYLLCFLAGAFVGAAVVAFVASMREDKDHDEDDELHFFKERE